MDPGRPAVRRRLAFAGAAALVVAVDQLTKQLALTGLDDGPVHLIGSFQLLLTSNDGAAFNLGSGKTTGIALLASVVALVLVRMGLRAERTLTAAGYGVVLGGALGNLVDRALRRGDGFFGGHVVDFIDPQWWPVFNVADAALWVGIGLLVIASVQDGRR